MSIVLDRRKIKAVPRLEHRVSITTVLNGQVVESIPPFEFTWGDSWVANASTADIGYTLQVALDEVRNRVSTPRARRR
ncbi:MAG TPA: hypothetical protein VID94_08365 [Acidimicrobiales bacterium]|jgi:hypothetical protein